MKDIKYCFYCEELLDSNNSTIDHIFPLFKGGTNEKENLVKCCKKCNNIKGGYTIHELIYALNKQLKWVTCEKRKEYLKKYINIFSKAQIKLKER